jgi:hypothetical protein
MDEEDGENVVPPYSEQVEVTALKKKLVEWGFDPGVEIGHGPKTSEAIEALQRKLGVIPTGTIDVGTQLAIDNDLHSASSVLKTASNFAIVPFVQPVQNKIASSLSTVVAPEEIGTLQQIITSKSFWVLAGGAILFWFMRSPKPAIEIEGLDDLSDVHEEDSEEDSEKEKPKKKRKPRKKKVKKENIIEGEFTFPEEEPEIKEMKEE